MKTAQKNLKLMIGRSDKATFARFIATTDLVMYWLVRKFEMRFPSVQTIDSNMASSKKLKRISKQCHTTYSAFNVFL